MGVADVLPPPPVTSGLGGNAYHWKTGARLGGVAVNGSGVNTGSNGAYAIDGLSAGSYTVSAAKVLTGGETEGVITSADALAALKIAVGRSPNADNSAATPYQLISADVTKDGKVTSADALAILKMAVKRSDAPAREWIFVDEKYDFWNEATGRFTTTNASLPKPADLAITVDPAVRSEVNLVALLKGDVNGSWTAPAQSTFLPDSYFQALASANQTAIHIAQFG